MTIQMTMQLPPMATKIIVMKMVNQISLIHQDMDKLSSLSTEGRLGTGNRGP